MISVLICGRRHAESVPTWVDRMQRRLVIVEVRARSFDFTQGGLFETSRLVIDHENTARFSDSNGSGQVNVISECLQSTSRHVLITAVPQKERSLETRIGYKSG